MEFLLRKMVTLFFARHSCCADHRPTRFTPFDSVLIRNKFIIGLGRAGQLACAIHQNGGKCRLAWMFLRSASRQKRELLLAFLIKGKQKIS